LNLILFGGLKAMVSTADTSGTFVESQRGIDPFMISAQFNRDDLLLALNYLSAALSDSDLAAARIQFCGDGKVLFSAVGAQLQVNYILHAEHSGAGVICVSGKQLSDYVKQLPSSKLSLYLDNEHRVCLKCGRSSAKMQMLRDSSSGLVVLPSCGVVLKVPAEKLSRWLDSFRDFVLIEDPRFYANGSLVWVTDNQLHSVTTDAHRLAKSSLIESFEVLENDGGKVLLSRKTLDELKKLCTLNPQSEILMKWNHELAVLGVEIEGYVMRATSMVGVFPPYESAMPKQIKTSLTLDLKLLQEGVKRVNLFADKLKVILMSFDGPELNLSSATQGVKEGEESVPLKEAVQQPFQVRFNCSQLIQVLGAMKGTEVGFHWDDVNRPMQLTFDADKDLHVFYLLVPIRM
jgi:DNA polymerase III sliding clamp (beta) subunit (PCNA family)